MKIPRYWAQESGSAQDPRGKWFKLAIWRWSDASQDDAVLSAQARVRELVERIKAGQTLDRYSYGERPLREEIIQGVSGDSGKEAGILTRNAYGATVLNASNAMFVDIDFKEQGALSSLSAQVQKLRGQAVPSEEDRTVAAIEQWAARNPGLGVRVYRTFGGLRCLMTNELFDPTQESSLALLRELKSDPLYITLCRDQGCFRARLSPKPWRCGAGKPPSKYPWQDFNAEMRFRAWDEKYRATSAKFAVCRLIKQIGSPEVHPDIQPILSTHDQMSCVESDLTLA
ncbi:MAG: hypothetical protein M1570_08715 [Chloroflexi bacterium]|nr:hypothetical protein [Chloroflexota bacterium]